MTTHELQLQMWRDENLVSVTRRFVEEACERVTTNFDVVGRIALTAHELLENAVKYGAGGSAHLRVCIESTGAGGRCSVEVRNRASASDVATLVRAIGELGGAASAFAHYQSLMRKNAKASGSGLGLARICAEGEMSLHLERVDDEVRLRAEGSFGDDPSLEACAQEPS